MRFARGTLLLTALVFAGFGVAMLVRPELVGVTGIQLPTPSARTEIRAFYGGLELGMALFLFLAARRDAWVRPGLVAMAAGLGGIALARAVGIAVDGSTTPVILGGGALEATGAILGFIALRPLGREG